jgi:hypothetical protein
MLMDLFLLPILNATKHNILISGYNRSNGIGVYSLLDKRNDK